MPSLTSDGQSLSIDGHRLWLVSGSVCYAKTPRALWAERLLAAKQAGLNCIETPVVWSLHEPRPGALTFDGELDLHTFVKQVGLLKMHCILRLGPYVGEGLDLGGMPAWLVERAGGRLRCAAPEFLQAASRFLAAVCDRVRDLQATARRSAGPLVLVQNEHQWCCGDEDQAEKYLGELARFSRENGINVPIANCNNLYAGAEGEIDGWAGSSHLFANLRQLRAVRTDQPGLALGLTLGHRGVWGRPLGEEVTPRSAMRRIAEVLAAGGQYNIDPFHGGTALGFLGGRSDEAPDAFLATSALTGAPLGEAGERGPLYNAVRRISTFASQFGRVFAALDPVYQPVTMALDETAAPARTSKARASAASPPDRIVAVEGRGSQGSVVLVFASEAGGGTRRGSIVLADGSTLPIDLGDQSVAWALLGTHLVGRSTLDYCNLCAFGVVGSVFVCFGPAGALGMLSINGSAFEATVPDGDEPHIEHHEGVSIVVCNQRTIDSTYLSDQGVFIGASSLDASGQPRAQSGFRRITFIAPDGQSSLLKPNPAPPLRPAPAFSAWARASCHEYLEGASERFAAIDGPASLDRLGAPLGYGWLRLRWKSSSTRTIKAGFFESADRLHLFVGGRPLSVCGLGPGAEEEGPVRLPVRTGENTLVVLADNLGRASAGTRMGEHKGLFGQIWESTAMRPGTPRLDRGDPVAPLSFHSPIFGLEESDLTDGRRVTWRFQHRKRTPVYIRFGAHALHGLLMLNGKPIAVLSPGGGECVTLEPEATVRGGNIVQAAIVGDAEAALPALRQSVRFFEGTECLSARAHWAFAKWERPAAGRFKPPARSAGGGANAEVRGLPTWWRATFSAAGAERPLFLEATGLSKGQMYLNGVNIGRYFVSTASGRAVPPQSRYYLPEPWLKVGQANELVLFDEHGFSPERCRLAYAGR